MDGALISDITKSVEQTEIARDVSSVISMGEGERQIVRSVFVMNCSQGLVPGSLHDSVKNT